MNDTQNEEITPDDEIRALMKSSLAWQPLNSFDRMPFDTSKPNFHDSKSDFLHEKETIERIIEHLIGMYSLSLSSANGSDQQRHQTTAKLREIIEDNAKKFAPGIKVESASDLARKNVMDTNYFTAFMRFTIFNVTVYRQRLKELEDQERQFWNVKSRPPNYYARTIALRFARFYARQSKQKPTYGTSRDGPHPSTDYGRILEKIFQILNIKGSIRGPAEWAIPQITDDDLKPLSPISALLGLQDGLGEIALSTPITRDRKGAE